MNDTPEEIQKSLFNDAPESKPASEFTISAPRLAEDESPHADRSALDSLPTPGPASAEQSDNDRRREIQAEQGELRRRIVEASTRERHILAPLKPADGPEEYPLAEARKIAEPLVGKDLNAPSTRAQEAAANKALKRRVAAGDLSGVDKLSAVPRNRRPIS